MTSSTVFVPRSNIPYIYYWSTAETTQQITPLTNGTYWLLVEDINQCISDTIYFNVTWITTDINEFYIRNFSIYHNKIGQHTEFKIISHSELN